MASTTLNAVDSPLLRLPAELRNIIFAHVYAGTVYTFDETTKTTARTQPDFMGWVRLLDPKRRVGLSLVCRQTHNETILLPYELGTFCFLPLLQEGLDGLRMLERFLERRSTAQIDAMCNVRFTGWSRVLRTHWHQQRTATYWVATLEALSVLTAAIGPEDESISDVSSIGPADK